MPELECRESLQDPGGREPPEAAHKCASANRGLWLAAGLCRWLEAVIAAKLRPQQAVGKRKNSSNREWKGSAISS
jgi:hypothetical protein